MASAMRLLFLGLLPVMLMMSACFGGSDVRPTPVASVITPVLPTPAGVGFLTRPEDRLSPSGIERQPTLTVPEVTRAAAYPPVVSTPSSEGAAASPVPSTPFPVSILPPALTPISPPFGLHSQTLARALALSTPSCIDDFRSSLVNYRGDQPFGPETVVSLSDRLLERRPDCAEQGWAPELSLGQVCWLPNFAGHPLPPSLIFQRFTRFYANPTSSGDNGLLIIHFTRLPFQEVAGCWVFAPRSQQWRWMHVTESSLPYTGPEIHASGLDKPSFLSCETALRLYLSEYLLVHPEEGVLVSDVADGIDYLRLHAPRQCGTSIGSGSSRFFYWQPFPQAASRDGCVVSAPTGVNSDGILVVNWHPDHSDSQGNICWALDTEGQWLVSRASEG